MSEYNVSNEDAAAHATAAYEQVRQDQEAAEARSQYINFAILAVILLVVVLIVALSAPFISQRIVAAVLGENLPQTMIINQGADARQETQEEESVAPVVEEEVDPVAVEEEVIEETAVEPEPTIHTVQQGDTLTSIAAQYQVSIDLILQANSIPNPTNILIGTELIIPTE